MFLSPLMLFGAFAVSVPIIIHLISRRQHKRVKWAAMRFLIASVEKTKKRLNIEDLLLLLLRCLAVVLLALTFARPALSGAGGGLFGEPPITGVIVLDHSMSMGYSDGTTTRFERAKQAVQQLLDSAPPGSSFALLYAGDVVEAVIPQPTLDLSLVRQTVGKAEVSDRTTRLQPALRRAVDTLQSKAAARREVHVFTDGQASGLTPLSAIQSITEAAGASGIRTRMVVIADTARDNVAVTDLSLDGGICVVHRPARFSVEVANTGPAAARNVRVSLQLGNAAPVDEKMLLVLAPGERQRVTLSATPTEPVYQSVTATITGDRLPADDTRSISIRPVDSVSILIVDPAVTTARRDTGAFFLRNAFAPVPRSQQADYFVRTTAIAPAELADARLDTHQIVVLTNVPDFTPATVDRLTGFVRRGGGLIVFPGPLVVPGTYNTQLLEKAGLLPASLGEPVGDATDRERFFVPQGDNFEHEIARVWNDPNAGSPASVRVYRAFDLTPDPTARQQDVGAPRTVIRFAPSATNATLSGKPMLIERPFGAGRVLLFATTADTIWTDLAVRPAVLVPLLQRTLGLVLSSGDASMNLPVGSTLSRITGGDVLGREASITRPAKRRAATDATSTGVNTPSTPDPALLTDTVSVQLRDNTPVFRYDNTGRAGAYVARFKGEPPLTWVFAAQIDAEESNLKPLEIEELSSLEPDLKVVAWDPTGESSDVLAASGATEIWSLFAFIVLGLFTAEVLLGNWFSRSR